MKKLGIGIVAVICVMLLAFPLGGWTASFDEQVSITPHLTLSSGLLNLTRLSGSVNPTWALPDPKDRGRYFEPSNTIELRMDSNVRWDLNVSYNLTNSVTDNVKADMLEALDFWASETNNVGAFWTVSGWINRAWNSFNFKLASRNSSAYAGNMKLKLKYRWDTDDIADREVPPQGTYNYNVVFTMTAT